MNQTVEKAAVEVLKEEQSKLASAVTSSVVSITKSDSNVATTSKPGSEQLSNTQKVLTSLVAGGMAGALAKTIIAPLDRAKINFQICNVRYSTKEAIRFLYNSYQSVGLRSLWRGNSATMARIIPYAAIQFSSHEQWKRLLHVDTKEHQTYKFNRFLAGSLAGVTGQTATYPLDLARARLAVTKKCRYRSVLQVFISTFREEGLLALYRGYTPTILGVIPYAGTSFFTYEQLKKLHAEVTGKSETNPFDKMMFGAVAGLLGQSASYPLDIVRRRMQTAVLTGNSDSYKTIIQTVVTVYRKEGLIHGLYKGLSMNWIKGPIAVGISFSTYDTLQATLRQSSLFHNR